MGALTATREKYRGDLWIDVVLEYPHMRADSKCDPSEIVDALQASLTYRSLWIARKRSDG